MVRRLVQLISWVALLGTIVPPALFLAKRIDLAQSQWWMLLATVVWFVATPLWMGRKQEST